MSSGEIVADGGVAPPERGEERVDREATSDGRVLVLDVHTDDRADTWVVEELGETVAAVNPEYPDDDPVVAAVYVDALEDAEIADRSPDEVEHAANLGEVGVYHFPASRLAGEEVDTDHGGVRDPSGGEDDPHPSADGSTGEDDAQDDAAESTREYDEYGNPIPKPDDKCDFCGVFRVERPEGFAPEIMTPFGEVEYLCQTCREQGRGMK